MNWLDLIILALLLITTIFGWINGMVRALFGFAALMLGVLAANRGATAAGQLVVAYLTSPTARTAFFYIIIFLLVAFLTMMVGKTVTNLVKKAGLSRFDRFLGAFFGLAKGYALAALIVMLIMSGFEDGKAIARHSRLAPVLQSATLWFLTNLPEDLRQLLPHDVVGLTPSPRMGTNPDSEYREALQRLRSFFGVRDAPQEAESAAPAVSKSPGGSSRYSEQGRRELDQSIERND
ncbi:MAG: CvpA family protein [Candidatus Tectomicrobia bacterium]|nr:CvpA family protein [Candidatus Tectomicrobia bacterium]